MDKLFEQFLNEKLYLKGVSKQTIQWYHYSFKAFKKSLTGDITKQMLADFVIELRKSGVSTTTMNDYIRGVNVFLGWLYENEYIPKVLKIKRVKQEETIIETFTDKHLEAFISYKPKDAAEIRLHTLLLFLIDTGCRIEEAITLTRQAVDLDSLAVKVKGKGNKERIVPISLELRSVFKSVCVIAAKLKPCVNVCFCDHRQRFFDGSHQCSISSRFSFPQVGFDL